MRMSEAMRRTGNAARATGGAFRSGARAGATATRRTSRLVHRVTGASGASRTGLATLIELTAAGGAGDAFVAVSLAGTIFFSTSVDAARGKVVLFLLVTMAPFAVLAPFIGPALDRMQQGRRYLLAGTLLARGLLCWGMSAAINSPVTLLPAAFGILVLQKAYGVARASVTPRLLPAEITLVAANARSQLITLTASMLGGAVAAGIQAAAGSTWVLRAGTLIYLAAMFLALRLPDQVDVPPPVPAERYDPQARPARPAPPEPGYYPDDYPDDPDRYDRSSRTGRRRPGRRYARSDPRPAEPWHDERYSGTDPRRAGPGRYDRYPDTDPQPAEPWHDDYYQSEDPRRAGPGRYDRYPDADPRTADPWQDDRYPPDTPTRPADPRRDNRYPDTDPRRAGSRRDGRYPGTDPRSADPRRAGSRRDGRSSDTGPWPDEPGPNGTLPVDAPTGPSGSDGRPPADRKSKGRRRLGGLSNLGAVVGEAMRGNAVLRAFSGYMVFFLAFYLRTSHFSVSHNFALGALVAAAAAGGLAAMAIGSLLRARAPQFILFAMLTLAPGVTAACAWFFSFGAVITVAFTAALAAGLAKLALDSTVQREVGEDIRSSAFAVSETLNQVSNVAGSLAGVLVSILNNGQAGLAIAAAGLTAALVTLIARRRRRIMAQRAYAYPAR
jgi:uncharacterized protein (DUF697 family)